MDAALATAKQAEPTMNKMAIHHASRAGAQHRNQGLVADAALL
jgi:hypothetical protein